MKEGRKMSQLFDFSNKTYVMGILNITPDSFSDGGKFNTLEKAIEQAQLMEREGADIIDVGAESTRPNHLPISESEEVERVVPFIEALKKHITIPISIDTYKAATAEAAIKAGAAIINDIWGAKKDANMAHIAAKYKVPIILMHNRTEAVYESIIPEMIADLQASVTIAKQAGVHDEQIIIDPGIGFGKTMEDNYTVLRELDKITEALHYPLLLATSRKSFISKVLSNPPKERDNATGATTCLGIMKGARMVRVHDVKRHVELAKMMDAMIGKKA